MLDLKPHTAIVRPVGQTRLADGTASNKQILSQGTAVRCYAEQMSAGDALMKFGLELRNPCLILCEIEDAHYFEAEFEVQVGNRFYNVKGDPAIYEIGDETDHAEVLMEFKMFALPEKSS
jgi:hypothetical protein